MKMITSKNKRIMQETWSMAISVSYKPSLEQLQTINIELVNVVEEVLPTTTPTKSKEKAVSENLISWI